MKVKFKQINETCYYFDAPVNIGYVLQHDKGMLIDAGIDDSVMRKVLRKLAEKELPLTHLFITHAHADHYGGAHFLQKRQDVHTIAPSLEEAILRYPQLEPLYLFGGNDPLSELHNKFLEGKPVRIDEVMEEGIHVAEGFQFKTYRMPGHSYHQLALESGQILFAGDSYFGESELHKHKIPYITDTGETIDSLHKLLAIDCEGAVPGHGTYETNFKNTVRANIAYHENLLELVYEQICAEENGISQETIVAVMCAYFEINPPALSQWLLYRTAVTAYLTCLIKKGAIDHAIEAGKWIFRKKPD